MITNSHVDFHDDDDDNDDDDDDAVRDIWMNISIFRDSWFLIIRGVQETDAGKYICQVQRNICL